MEYLCREYNIRIVGQKNYGIGYTEPRIYNREQLLRESYEDALKRWKKSTTSKDKIFIFEDTSVVIDALSSVDNEVPGLDIKYWMKDNTFETVDTLLKKNGNNRQCTVRSDIIMHIPESLKDAYDKEFYQFTGKVSGSITTEEHKFDTNPIYPWLDNKTFNKWFVPRECVIPLGMLPIETADKYDFRKIAITEMIDFLVSYNVIKNKADIVKKNQRIINFDPTFILCGPTCAGKSTLAKYLSDNYNYFHVEASDFMWLKYYETHGIDSEVKIGDFAKQMLSVNPSIVTEQIIEYFKNITDQNIVISGFRNPKEVEYMMDKSQFTYNELIYINANIQIRYQRECARKRDDMENNYSDFLKKDDLQNNLGLSLIKSKVEYETMNEGSFHDLYDNFNKVYNFEFPKKPSPDYKTFQKFDDLLLEKAILIALFLHEEDFFTTTEIANIINSEVLNNSYENRKNNVSRYFNFSYHPYYDIKIDKEKKINIYRINFTGKSMAKRILSKSAVFKFKTKKQKKVISKQDAKLL